MYKRIFFSLLCAFVFLFVLSVCYGIGVLRNWTSTTIFLCCFFAILVTFSLKFFLGLVHNYISTEKYRKLLTICYRKKITLTLDSHFRYGFNIISKKGIGKAPWFLLTGVSENNTSLLKKNKQPVFYSNGQNHIANKNRTMRWFFFRDLSVLELSSKIYNNPILFNSVMKILSSRICKKQPPQGVVLIIPVEKLLNHDYADIQLFSQQTRNFIEQFSSHLHQNIPVFIVISGCEHISGYTALARKIHQKNDMLYPVFWGTNKLPSDGSEYDSSCILASLKSNITLSICRALDDKLSDREKNEILLFPDKLNYIKDSLDVFISSFCIDNVFFLKPNISRVYLSGELALGKGMDCSVSDVLISEILPQTYNLNINHAKKNTIRTSVNALIVMIIVFFLGYGAYSSYNIYGLKRDFVDTTPTFLIEQILKYEDGVKSNMLYFPFRPVLDNQYLYFRESLYKKIRFETLPVQERIDEYKKKFIDASPSGKRDLIMSLSSSLIIWDKMAQNESLSELIKYQDVYELIKITKPQEKISSITSLAIERDEIQKKNGVTNIIAFRNLLTELIKSDPSYSWFVSEDVNIPAVNITDFWKGENTPVYLSGIWTLQGQNKLHQWYGHIKEAYGSSMVPEEFTSFVHHLDERRQEHFGHFIMSIARVRKNSHSGLMTPLQLSNLIHNRSSEHKFFQFIDDELRSIPESLAQDWLSDFRLLYRLFSLKVDNGMMRQIKKYDLILRTYLLYIFNSSQMYTSPDYFTVWMDWLNVLHSTVNSELLPESSVKLIRDAMRSDPKNKFVILFGEFKKVRSIIKTKDTDPVIDAVWDIYEQQNFQLLDHAVTYTGCWLNEQWKNSVVSQLNSDGVNFNHTEIQEKIYKNIINFLQGPVDGFLLIEPTGVRLLSFKGRTISFSPSFISFVNNFVSFDDLIDVQLRKRTQNQDDLINTQVQLDELNKIQQKLESQPYKITISSAPATISGNTVVKPIGTSLVLECKTGKSSIRSMNFSDSSIFTWYPGSCNSVSIDIAFPDFSVHYKLTGASAWIDFINKFSDGESELITEDFSPESRDLLESLEIKGVLVRYKLSDASDLIQAYIEWEQLKLEKDKIENVQATLSNKLLTIPSWENSGWISKLPIDLIKCSAVWK
ncbi:TPA: type VI secretion protein [Escherichia coli]|uniref:type VI secretion protein IcmF/TssM N-terminal domain-containing protein n=1 Tax=Escherichia coli TaxID=562 RepID=UPI000BEA7A46|nr:type VI secretion protein IcmF/TssM N-terminal domain-containing protein [Escherichia coli]EGN7972565.1 type VI secretion protein [Escherichia coli]HAH2544792.1 type VI secretion protein [Escherichia coli]HAI1330858.1 type VI secretion protein [Escherichia coli]HAI1377566.1 type VI secretion protein [Escherichia coli]HAI1521769.1 type VI secretion protein [Escherichia coli]